VVVVVEVVVVVDVVVLVLVLVDVVVGGSVVELVVLVCSMVVGTGVLATEMVAHPVSPNTPAVIRRPAPFACMTAATLPKHVRRTGSRRAQLRDCSVTVFRPFMSRSVPARGAERDMKE
jgi:hypothetical protein